MDITEKQFSKQVEDLFKLFGWKYSHTYEQTHYARRSTKGFPDYVATRPPRLLFIELKSDKGILTPEQEEWLEHLKGCQTTMLSEPLKIKRGIAYMRLSEVSTTQTPEVFFWRPHQLDEIVTILR